jgi:outer membrane receptor for ferrienterochelin and colicins
MPRFSADAFSTDWGVNVDIGFKANVGKAASVLTGINYFNYSNPIDNNKDNFTDLTLQIRFPFSKMELQQKEQQIIGGTLFYEDRWGGELQWRKKYRGGSEVYGEFIPSAGNYSVLTNFLLPKNVVFLFLIRSKTLYMVIYLAKQRVLVLGN